MTMDPRVPSEHSDVVKAAILQREGRSLLGVDPERRFSTPPPKAGLGAAERVNEAIHPILLIFWEIDFKWLI